MCVSAGAAVNSFNVKSIRPWSNVPEICFPIANTNIDSKVLRKYVFLRASKNLIIFFIHSKFYLHI